MKHLIVNADDFGYTRGVNSGVIRCFRDGIVTSTTIMANGPAFEHAIECAKQNPCLGVGCHLVLLDGWSVEAPRAIPSLTDSEGRLPRTLAALVGRITAGTIRKDDVTREIRAQIAKVMEAGITPTHLDSHKHTHSHPWILERMMQAAEEFGIRRVRKPFEDASTLLRSAFSDGWSTVRQSACALVASAASPRFEKLTKAHGILAPDRFWGISATDRLNRAAVLGTIRSMSNGVNELMCHPGECDEDLQHSETRLKDTRAEELKALTDPAIRSAVEAQGIKLMSYRDLE